MNAELGRILVKNPDIGTLIVARLVANVPAGEVKRELVSHGVDPAHAGPLVDSYADSFQRSRLKARRQGALRKLLIGVPVLLIGGGLTLGTYLDAARRGGGSYTLLYGAIVVGAVYTLAGLVQLFSGADWG